GYYDTVSRTHGFVRDSGGTITVFDPPSSVATSVTGINAGGAIVGNYGDGSGSGWHGFVRANDGTFTEFDVPGNLGSNTYATSINAKGAIAGYYQDTNYSFHGFLRF